MTQVKKNSDISLPYTNNVAKQMASAAKTMASSESVTNNLLQEAAPVHHRPQYGTMDSMKRSENDIRNVVQIFDNDIATSRIGAINVRDSLSNKSGELVSREPSRLKVAIGLTSKTPQAARRYSKPARVFDFTTPLSKVKRLQSGHLL